MWEVVLRLLPRLTPPILVLPLLVTRVTCIPRLRMQPHRSLEVLPIPAFPLHYLCIPLGPARQQVPSLLAMTLPWAEAPLTEACKSFLISLKLLSILDDMPSVTTVTNIRHTRPTTPRWGEPGPPVTFVTLDHPTGPPAHGVRRRHLHGRRQVRRQPRRRVGRGRRRQIGRVGRVGRRHFTPIATVRNRWSHIRPNLVNRCATPLALPWNMESLIMELLHTL